MQRSPHLLPSAGNSTTRHVFFLVQGNSKNDNNFDGVYEFQALKEPDAKLIRDLENLREGECLTEVASHDIPDGHWQQSAASAG